MGPHVITKLLFLKRFLCLPRCPQKELFSVLILERNIHYPKHFKSHVFRFIFGMEIVSQHSRESKGCRVKTRIRLKDHSNTPPPQRHPSSAFPASPSPSGRPQDLREMDHFYIVFLLTHHLRARLRVAEQKPTFCRAHVSSVPMMLPSSFLSARTSNGCGGKKKRKKRGRTLAEPDYFKVSSYPKRDRVDKAPLVFSQVLYRPPPPSLPQGGPALHAVFHWLL